MSLPTGIGELIAGKYRVERLLGAGGMGLVFAATHEALHERRAIKLLQPKGIGRAELCERFLREAQTVARLRSEHVARVHDVGTLDDGVPYMVMEYVEGTDLATFLRRRGALPVEEAVLYALQACEALAEAHRLGIVHRDIKPANLFVTSSTDGSPSIKVLDFGIAKTAKRLTDVGVVLGTPRYMPPEQLRATRDVDARADLWAIGVVLYEMVSGKTPFQGTTTEVFEAIFEREPAAPTTYRPDLPAGLSAVILRCLEKHRDRRYPHVAALAEALGPFADESARSLPARVRRVLGPVDPGAGEVVSPLEAPVSPLEAPVSPLEAPMAIPAEKPSLSAGGPQTESLVRAPEAVIPAGVAASPTESLAPAKEAPVIAPTITETGTDTATTILVARGPTATLEDAPARSPGARPRNRLYAIAVLAWMITTAVLAAVLLWLSRRPDDSASVQSPSSTGTVLSQTISAPPGTSAVPSQVSPSSSQLSSAPAPASAPSASTTSAPSVSAPSRPSPVAAKPGQPLKPPASPRPSPAGLPTTRSNF